MVKMKEQFMQEIENKISNRLILSIISLTALSGIILSNYVSVSATEVTATANATVHVSEACSLTANNTSPHTATINNGTYAENIGSTKFTIRCNDASGFALYAIGFSDDTYGNTDMIGNATSLTIPTGTDALNGTSASHWAMKLTKVVGSSTYLPANLSINNNFNSYHVVPMEYTKVATYTANSMGPDGLGSVITITYNARVSGTQVADSYVGKVKYTLVHPSTAAAPTAPLKANDCPAGNICYAPNASDIIGSMVSIGGTGNEITSSPQAGKINVGTDATTINLIAPNYKRSGYGFAGWSTAFEATNESTIYGPNEIISADPTNGGVDISENGLILYPVWVASTGILQLWDGCNSRDPVVYDSNEGKIVATLDDVIALTDARDGNVYTVAKLADGKCWMLENLRLDAEHSRGDINNTRAQGYGTTFGGFIGLADSEDHFSSDTTANSHYSTNGNNNTINIQTYNYPAYRTPRYNNNDSDMSDGATNSKDTLLEDDYLSSGGNNYRWYGYGNYYTWAAAIANTAYYTNDSSDLADTSICPFGWKLPLGNVSNGVLGEGEENDAANLVGSFSYLDRKMGGSGQRQNNNPTQAKKWRAFPNNFVYPGVWELGYLNFRTEYAFYWSSSANAYNNTKALYLSRDDLVSPAHGRPKYSAISVRCIKK